MAFLVFGRDDEATKLRAFPLVLREGAKAWYQTLALEERRDLDTVKTAFIEEFRHHEPLEKIWRQLLELRQTSLNDYRIYEEKFSNLWEKWCASLGEGERVPECLKKNCFLAGLYPILQEKVKVKFPDTFEKTMVFAREKDRKLKFQAQLQGGVEPPSPSQPMARVAVGTNTTDQESSQQELLQQITNQLESLSINLVQGVRAPHPGNNQNRQEGQRQAHEYVCYNCGEVGHVMYFCPHPRRYQGNGNHRQAPQQQVTPPRARPPNGQQNAPMAPPIQILRPLPPPPQALAEIPPLPSGGEDRAVSIISRVRHRQIEVEIEVEFAIAGTVEFAAATVEFEVELELEFHRGVARVVYWLSINVFDGKTGHIQDEDSPKDPWDNLIAFNANNTRARRIQLKKELNTIKEGDLFVNDYTLKIKALCESLYLVGVAVDDDDKVEACLRGLGNAYKQTKASIYIWKNIPNF
ncbi:hypothetical protein L7F22_044893 [Adiantum nelumboides]|nr:hypothetical protein [Adiantum nelumboides]